MNIFKRVIRIISYIAIVCACFGLILCCCHSDVLVSQHYYFNSNKTTTHRYVAISDFHHRGVNFANGNLVDKIKEENPEAVFFVGDMVDGHIKDYSEIESVIDGLSPTPIYYVTGNHEDKDKDVFHKFLDRNKDKSHFHYIDDDFVDLGDNVCLYGLHDPSFDSEHYDHFVKDYGRLEESLNKFNINPNQFNILLAHRPELVDLYIKYDFDMIIAGHSHGGQVVLGMFNSFTLPGGTFRYAGGEYPNCENSNKTLYVSRGLGYSAMLPIRVNCNPEILTISLNSSPNLD